MAALDHDAAQMCVDGGVAVGVFDHHHVAKSALFARHVDHATSNATYGCAGRGCVVDAQMGTPRLQNRMKAHFEAAGHTRKRKWRCQIRATQTHAVGVVVTAFFGAVFGLRVFEPERLVSFAVVHKLGRHHAARAQSFAVCFERLVDD